MYVIKLTERSDNNNKEKRRKKNSLAQAIQISQLNDSYINLTLKKTHTKTEPLLATLHPTAPHPKKKKKKKERKLKMKCGN